MQLSGKNPPEELAKIAVEMGCKVLIPHHIDYPGDYMYRAKNLAEVVAATAPQIRYIIPEYGKWLSL